GLIEHHGGSSRLDRVGGMVRTAPAIAVLFGISALALAGIPPFSGFPAKFSVLASTAASGEWWAMGTGVLVGFLTLFSMVKIWLGAFWAPPTEDLDGHPLPTGSEPFTVRRPGAPLLMVVPTALLVVTVVAIGVFAGP